MPTFQVQPVTDEEEWQAARRIRRRVFVEEQQCPPEEEWDGHDDASRHLIGRLDGEVIAAARWRAVPGPSGEEIAAKLERFAVLPAHRGRGYGRALVTFALRDAQQAGFETLVLHAQAHLEAFYAGFGFARSGAPFMEAGLPHVPMIRRG